MDGPGRRAARLAAAIVAATGGCATAPPAGSGTDAREVIQVTTHAGPAPRTLDPSPVDRVCTGIAACTGPPLRSFGPSIEGMCTASNDRGSWTITAPGRLEVIPSRVPLRITCRREGYSDSSITLRCIAPGVRNAVNATRTVAAVPFLNLLVLPALPVVVAATKSQPDVGDADGCTYTEDASLHLWLERLRPP